ncbi:MAG: type VII secretion-associated serine protease mycosin [Micromonosporaceae bacterium]
MFTFDALPAHRRPHLRGGMRTLRAVLTIVLFMAWAVLGAPGAAYADKVRSQQWQLDALRIPQAWGYADGDGAVVAVLDSGVDASHPDLRGQVLPGTDLVDPGGDGRTDAVGHGTAIAAIIAGHNDGKGVVGIAPRAKILPVRVLDQENRYNDPTVVAEGLRWAVDHGADVVNLSLGGAQPSEDLAAAIQYAYDHDVVLVACAGNNVGDGDRQIWYPAREPGVIAVTGLDQSGTFWKLSLAGPQSVLAAPADQLVGATAGGGYTELKGTSFSAPMVSATAALVRSHWPDMNAANVANRLIRTARDAGPAGRDDQYGFGRVDPVAALTNPVTSVRENPLDTTPRSPGATGNWSASPAKQQAAPDTDDSGWAAALIGLLALAGAVAASTVMLRRRMASDPAEPLATSHHH